MNATPLQLDQSTLNVLQALPQAMWIFDPENLHIIWSNSASQQWLGLSSHELQNQSILALRPEKEQEELIQTLNEFKTLETLNSTWTIRNKSRQEFSAHFHWQRCVLDHKTSVLATITDLTEKEQINSQKKSLEQENLQLRASTALAERSFQQVFEATPGKFLVIRPGSYTIVAASDAYIQSTMTRRENLLGRHLFTIFPDDPNDSSASGEKALAASFRRVEELKASDVMGIQRYPILGPDGRFHERYWSVINSPVTTDEKELAYIIHRIEDVTDLLLSRENPLPPKTVQHDLFQEVLLRFPEVRQTLSKLQEQEILLRAAEKMLNILVWEIDIHTRRITWRAGTPVKSEGFRVILGVNTMDEYLKQIHPEDRSMVLTAFNNGNIEDGQQFSFQHRVTRTDGTVSQIRGTGHKHQKLERPTIVGILQDITDTYETLAHLDRANKLIEIAGIKAKLGGWRMNLGDTHISWTPQTAAIHEAPYEPAPTAEEAFSYYLPAYRSKIQRCYQLCITEGKPYDEVLQIKTRKGRVIWVRAIGEPEYGNTGRIIGAQGAFQDITEFIHEKTRNSDLEQRLFATLENMSDAFFIISSQFEFVYLNLRAENLLKRQREDLVGKNIWAEFPEAKDTPIYHLYRHAIETGNTFSVKFFYPPLSTWFKVNGYPTSEGLGIYFRDVSKDEEQQQAAKLLHERFVLVSKATNDVIWDWDLIKEEVWWNDAMTRVFGFQPDSLQSGPESWTERIHPADYQKVIDSIHEVIAGNGNHWNMEYRFSRSDGSYAIVHDRGFVIRDDDGNAIRMLGSMLDLTERRELEDKLRASQKLEAMGQLTGGVAHDFNNLLTVIMGNAETLTYRLKDNPPLRSLAEMTAKAAERGAELTSRLLSFARRQPLQPKTVDASQLIQESLALFRRVVPETIEIEAPESHDLWKIAVDPGQLEVALLNLVINGRDAISQSGKLHIRASNTQLEAEQCEFQDALLTYSFVKITVSDTGHGMTEETLSRAFEPFYTTKEVGKGSGLGLSMVFGFVKQSKGHIKIHSKPNQGAQIELYFPKFDPNEQ